MRYLILTTLLLLSNSLGAMYPYPLEMGGFAARPFTSDFAEISQEDVLVTIDETFDYAWFDITYQLRTSQNGFQIPLLFYTQDYLDSLVIRVNGKEIELKRVPKERAHFGDTLFQSFFYQFDTMGGGPPSTRLKTLWRKYDFIFLEDLEYLEVYLPEGEHTIQVSFNERSTRDGFDWVEKRYFAYSLTPSTHWKDFGVLNLTVDAARFRHPVSSNLGPPQNLGPIPNLGPPQTGELKGISTWRLDSTWALDNLSNSDNTPGQDLKTTGIITLNYIPEIGATARTLIAIGPKWMAQILGLILISIHFFLLYRRRKRHPGKKTFLLGLTGAILVPAFYIYGWMESYSLIDHFIGEGASGVHPETISIFVSIIFVFPIYCGLTALFDYNVEKRLSRRMN